MDIHQSSEKPGDSDTLKNASVMVFVGIKLQSTAMHHRQKNKHHHTLEHTPMDFGWGQTLLNLTSI